MTQSLQSDESKSATSACGKNHIAIVVGFCLISVIPGFLYWAGGLLPTTLSSTLSGAVTFLLFWGLVYLCILGVVLWEAVNLILNEGLSSCCRKGRIAVAAGICLVPWISLITLSGLAPGGLGLFLRSELWIFLGVTALWQILGFILLIYARSPVHSFLVIFFLSCRPVLCWRCFL